MWSMIVNVDYLYRIIRNVCGPALHTPPTSGGQKNDTSESSIQLFPVNGYDTYVERGKVLKQSWRHVCR
jgi:hypothetical protein